MRRGDDRALFVLEATVFGAAVLVALSTGLLYWSTQWTWGSWSELLSMFLWGLGLGQLSGQVFNQAGIEATLLGEDP